MRFMIYEGAIGQVDKVLYEGEGNWVEKVRSLNYEVNPFVRCLHFPDGKHIDFGSWSVFVKIIEE